MESDLETVARVYREVRWAGVSDLPAYRAAHGAYCAAHPGAAADPRTRRGGRLSGRRAVGPSSWITRNPSWSGLAVGAVLDSRKVGKHFAVDIRDGHLSWRRRAEQIEQEARLDGIYVIRTSVSAEHLDAAETVQAYKDLSRAERAFRSLKTVDLEIRPIRHWAAPRVRAHVFLCMLAYHVEWHLRQALAPLLFHDTELDAARAERASPVAATEPSDAVKAKKATKRSPDGLRIMSFADLLAHLGTLARNTMRAPVRPTHRFNLYSTPTTLQEAAFRLLALDPLRVQ